VKQKNGVAVNKILLATMAIATFFLGQRTALSADVPVVVAGPPPVAYEASVPTLFYFWNGPYLGVHGGWGWTSTKGLNASGDFGGGQLGYNYQTGNLVFGVEADGALGEITSHTVTIPFLGAPNTIGYRDDGLASLRGRFGFAMSNLLFYGTAGGGWVHSKASTLVAGSTSAGAWQGGWSAGAGVEYGFLPSWSVKAEYLHYGVSNTTYFGTFNTGNVGVETFKIGVNYLFR
jgi:outer membrane immunogenic protein